MPTFQLLSDLHFEFHHDQGARFLNELDPEGVDCLLLAGDICTIRQMDFAIRGFSAKYPRVLMTTGNHEYYGSSPAEVHGLLSGLTTELDNFTWLRNDVADVGGVKVAGTTLWFENFRKNKKYKHGMNDFHQIREFVPWVFDENTLAQAFLNRVAGDVDIIMTHHMPHPECVSLRYRVGQAAPYNRYFCCDMSALINEKQPSVWTFGHTHDRKDFLVGSTRLLSNPKGYPHEREFPERGSYQPKLTFEVSRQGE